MFCCFNLLIRYLVAAHSGDPASWNTRTPSSGRDFLSIADAILGWAGRKGLVGVSPVYLCASGQHTTWLTTLLLLKPRRWVSSSAMLPWERRRESPPCQHVWCQQDCSEMARQFQKRHRLWLVGTISGGYRWVPNVSGVQHVYPGSPHSWFYPEHSAAGGMLLLFPLLFSSIHRSLNLQGDNPRRRRQWLACTMLYKKLASELSVYSQSSK